MHEIDFHVIYAEWIVLISLFIPNSYEYFFIDLMSQPEALCLPITIFTPHSQFWDNQHDFPICFSHVNIPFKTQRNQRILY